MNLKTLFGKKGAKTIKNAVWREHPISSATLGICSALAISNKVENAIAMSAGAVAAGVSGPMVGSTVSVSAACVLSLLFAVYAISHVGESGDR